MAVGMAWRIVAAAGALALAAGRTLPAQEGPRIHRTASGVVFELPEGARVFERDLYVDTPLEASPRRRIRLVPPGVTEEQSLLGRFLAEIEVRRVSGGRSLEDWADEQLPAGVEARSRRIRIDGREGLRRDFTLPGGGGEVREAFVLVSGSLYRVSAGRLPGSDTAFTLLLETLALPEELHPLPSPPPLPAGATAGAHEVRVVYLVPSDRVADDGYAQALERNIRELQHAFRDRLGTGATYSLHEPVVEVLVTPHPVSWYQTEAPASSFQNRFWESVVADGFALTGGIFDDPNNRWLFHIDADPLCQQVIGGTSG